jgi:hypothetical protein
MSISRAYIHKILEKENAQESVEEPYLAIK